MILVGVAFIVFWLLVEVFAIEVALAALVVGVGAVLLGLVLGERLPARNP